MASTPITLIDTVTPLRLNEGDERLADFYALDLDVETIIEWANCQNSASRQNRTRFVETFPVLVPMLLWNSDDTFSSEIIKWIDDGEPLVENIAGLMGDVDPEVVQFLIEKPLSLISARWVDEELDLVFALSCVPPEKRPQSEADWEMFADYWHAIHPVPWDASGHFFRELCCLGYGSVNLMRLGLSRDELHRLSWVSDYISFLTTWAKSVVKSASNVVPFLRNGKRYSSDTSEPEEAWARRYFSGLSVTTIFNQAMTWRIVFQDAVATTQRESNDPELVQWPALFRQSFVVDQVRVCSITTIEEAMLARAAFNCFDADFVESCLLGDGYPVTLTDRSGNYISCAMIHLISEGDKVFPYISDHFRPNGDFAHLREEDVLEAALNWLRVPDQQPWLESLVNYHADRRETMREKLDALGVLSFETASRVVEQVVIDFDVALAELSSLRL